MFPKERPDGISLRKGLDYPWLKSSIKQCFKHNRQYNGGSGSALLGVLLSSLTRSAQGAYDFLVSFY